VRHNLARNQKERHEMAFKLEYGYCKGIYVAYSNPPKYSCDYTEYDDNDNETKTELVSGYYKHGICVGCEEQERDEQDSRRANERDF